MITYVSAGHRIRGSDPTYFTTNRGHLYDPMAYQPIVRVQFCSHTPYKPTMHTLVAIYWLSCEWESE